MVDQFSVLVPETPDKACGKPTRRKSDGVQYVKESPNLDAIKQGRTPRSLNASLQLRRKTSFYSGEESSRCVKAAEEQRQVQQLQNFNAFSNLLETSKRPSSRRLFDYHKEDGEVAIKSPFKIPTHAATSPLRRERKNSSSCSRLAGTGRALDFQSPIKPNSPSPSKRKRQSSTSGTTAVASRILDFQSPLKHPSPLLPEGEERTSTSSKTPIKRSRSTSSSSKSASAFAAVQPLDLELPSQILCRSSQSAPQAQDCESQVTANQGTSPMLTNTVKQNDYDMQCAKLKEVAPTRRQTRNPKNNAVSPPKRERKNSSSCSRLAGTGRVLDFQSPIKPNSPLPSCINHTFIHIGHRYK